jgi:hypothetical protein
MRLSSRGARPSTFGTLRLGSRPGGRRVVQDQHEGNAALAEGESYVPLLHEPRESAAMVFAAFVQYSTLHN